jgi:hypothetical protein
LTSGYGRRRVTTTETIFRHRTILAQFNCNDINNYLTSILTSHTFQVMPSSCYYIFQAAPFNSSRKTKWTRVITVTYQTMVFSSGILTNQIHSRLRTWRQYTSGLRIRSQGCGSSADMSPINNLVPHSILQTMVRSSVGMGAGNFQV